MERLTWLSHTNTNSAAQHEEAQLRCGVGCDQRPHETISELQCNATNSEDHTNTCRSLELEVKPGHALDQAGKTEQGVWTCIVLGGVTGVSLVCLWYISGVSVLCLSLDVTVIRWARCPTYSACRW